MSLPAHIVLFALVVTMGIGLPALGDASLIEAGTPAGEGRLNVVVVLVTAMVAWIAGSLAGYEIGARQGRSLLDHPGRLENMRLKLLAKGDHAFAHHNFAAAVTMPAFVSGIFRIRFHIFILGALAAGIGFIGMYVGLSYFLGAEIAKRIGDAGTKAVLGVLVIVAIGVSIKAGVSKWRATRQNDPLSSKLPWGHDKNLLGGQGTDDRCQEPLLMTFRTSGRSAGPARTRPAARHRSQDRGSRSRTR
jgi:membrane protein DedA with SNARE-associated domain